MAVQGAGLGMQMGGELAQGRDTQAIANQRASVDILNAKYVKENAVEQAGIQAEEGQKLIARQKVSYAASGVMMNVGAPLVVEAQTRADIYRDIGFTLQRGEQQSKLLLSEAEIEKAQGKIARRNSIWDTVSTGIGGLGSMAYLGYKGGLFNTNTPPAPPSPSDSWHSETQY